MRILQTQSQIIIVSNNLILENGSPHGFWLFVAGKEYFLGFDNFPWFRSAPVNRLFNVEFSHGNHLHWPELDVDLDLERIEHPEKFPLVARA